MYFSRGWEVVKVSSNDNAFILGFQKEKVRQSNLKGGVTHQLVASKILVKYCMKS